MMGLIFRPWMPPSLLTCFTKSVMALVCSPYSASSAKPSLPASELSDTTGKTTLMACWVTPRLDVLAELTGASEARVEAAADEVVVEPAARTRTVVTDPTVASTLIKGDRGRHPGHRPGRSISFPPLPASMPKHGQHRTGCL